MTIDLVRVLGAEDEARLPAVAARVPASGALLFTDGRITAADDYPTLR